jgi:peroxiredoxin/predicted 2-oxoglutarate/Fe(II)-dependent dioxygenase YbiX
VADARLNLRAIVSISVGYCNMAALTLGDRAPWFTSATAVAQASNQDFVMGGYRAVLFFFGSSRNQQVNRVLADFCAAQQRFEQMVVHFFGISIDPRDRDLEQLMPSSQYCHWIWDFDGEISMRYQLCQLGQDGQGITYDPTTFVLNENLQILNLFPVETQVAHAQQVFSYLETLTPRPAPQLITQQAPVLLIPGVFPGEFCQELMSRYAVDGGTESGFMRQEGDKTIVVLDPAIKRRRDWLITDPKLLEQINALLARRVLPEIEKAFQFRVTCFERYVVACYQASNQGFFQPHRDNTAAGNAHRRFALTLNLNGGYEGGCLRFPEFSADLYAPGPGSAAVFSCSLLHEATPVTQGQRFVLLSFLYGDEDAKLRQQTQSQIVRAGSTPLVGNDRIQAASTQGSAV